MKVRNLWAKALLLVAAILIFSSCRDSSVNSSGSTDIAGSVRGLFNNPLNNVKVTINNQTSVTSTEGTFSLKNVTLPFDMLVTDSIRNYRILYKNVSANNLIVGLPVIATSYTSGYDVVVHYPASLNVYQGKLYFVDNTYNIMGVTEISNSVPPNIGIPAPDGLTLNGNVYLITYTKDVYGNLDDYKYFAMKSNISVTQGIPTEVTITQQDLDTLGKETVTANLTFPAGNFGPYTILGLSFNKRRVSYYSSSLALATYTSNSISILIPKNIPVDFSPFLFSASNGDGWYEQQTKIIPKTGSNLQINFSEIPRILSPNDNATNIDMNSVFTFQKQPISNIIRFSLIDSIGNQTYNLCTSEGSITLGMLSPMLANLVSGRKYKYFIEQIGVGANTVGDFLCNGNKLEALIASTPQRYFTAK